MAKRVNISAARRDLPALFDRVIARAGESVIIARRDSPDEAVLVARSYIERLERAPQERKVPFKLMGSGALLVASDDVIGDLRRREADEADKRHAEFQPPKSRRKRR